MARKIIVLEVNDDIRKQIIRELKVLGMLKISKKINYLFLLEECNFNKIVGFYGSYQSRQSTQISICMEYLNGGSLDKMIGRYGRLPEKICGVISASVLDGLDYLKVSLRAKWSLFIQDSRVSRNSIFGTYLGTYCSYQLFKGP